jgi:hypothetical protein
MISFITLSTNDWFAISGSLLFAGGYFLSLKTASVKVEISCKSWLEILPSLVKPLNQCGHSLSALLSDKSAR